MVQGRGVDSSLNEVGRDQALRTFHALKDVPFDAIYTSELKRTKETVSHFTQNKVALAGLDEISWGNQEGVVPTEASKTLYTETLEQWRAGHLRANLGGGESPLDVQKRQKEAMEIIMNGAHSRVLICMHGRAMRILISWLVGTPLTEMDQYSHANCCYYKLRHANEGFEILASCVTSHLD